MILVYIVYNHIVTQLIKAGMTSCLSYDISFAGDISSGIFQVLWQLPHDKLWRLWRFLTACKLNDDGPDCDPLNGKDGQDPLRTLTLTVELSGLSGREDADHAAVSAATCFSCTLVFKKCGKHWETKQQVVVP